MKILKKIQRKLLKTGFLFSLIKLMILLFKQFVVAFDIEDTLSIYFIFGDRLNIKHMEVIVIICIY